MDAHQPVGWTLSPDLCRPTDATRGGWLEHNLEALGEVQEHAPAAGARTVRLRTCPGEPPRLALEDTAGRVAYLNGTREPVAEACRWVSPSVGQAPPWVVLIGAGLGHPIDAIRRVSPDTRVLVVETDGGMLEALLSARDWRPAIRQGWLRVIGANESREAATIWSGLGIETPPPVVVAPVLMRAAATLVIRNRMAFATARFGSSCDPRRPAVGQSMLKYDVIVALEHTAAMVDGAILEIGPYVGGSTMAMCRGLRAAGRRGPVVTVECGGAYLTHPSLPSSDILADLRRNLSNAGVADLVTIVEGSTNDERVGDAVRDALAGHAVGLLFIDADGHVDRDLDRFLPLCRPGTLVAIDDYVAPDAQEKAAPTQRAVDARIASGLLRPLGLYGWGTWFGTYAGAIDADATTTDFPYTLAAGVL